jgi:hypothetical protein
MSLAVQHMPNFLTDVMVVTILYNSLNLETTNDRTKKEGNKFSKKRRVYIFETLAYSGERSSQFARDGLLFSEKFPARIFDSLHDMRGQGRVTENPQ